MAEEEENNEAGTSEGGDAASSGGKKKLLIIAGAVVVLLLAVGIPIAYFAMQSEPADKTEHADKDAASHGPESYPEGFYDEDEYEEGEEPLGAIFPLETFVVNLSGGGYIRIQVQLEFSERHVPRRFYAKLVPIRDGLITLLANRTEKDVSTSQGRDQLKTDIKEVVNGVLRREDIKQIYFTQYIVR